MGCSTRLSSGHRMSVRLLRMMPGWSRYPLGCLTTSLAGLYLLRIWSRSALPLHPVEVEAAVEAAAVVVAAVVVAVVAAVAEEEEVVVVVVVVEVVAVVLR